MKWKGWINGILGLSSGPMLKGYLNMPDQTNIITTFITVENKDARLIIFHFQDA